MEVGFIMPVWYDIGRHRQSDVGFPTLAVGGGSMMSTYEALSLAINFCLLIIARRWLVSFNIEKPVFASANRHAAHTSLRVANSFKVGSLAILSFTKK